jgi:hypothetical protein
MDSTPLRGGTAEATAPNTRKRSVASSLGSHPEYQEGAIVEMLCEHPDLSNGEMRLGTICRREPCFNDTEARVGAAAAAAVPHEMRNTQRVEALQVSLIIYI